jgi:Na+/H+ antiporter NhaD/arsenite permease-like protein
LNCLLFLGISPFFNLENFFSSVELHLHVWVAYRLLGAVVVIAANAGGAWTPIGDVTTTMLWIHGQISTLPTMKVFSFSVVHLHDLF